VDLEPIALTPPPDASAALPPRRWPRRTRFVLVFAVVALLIGDLVVLVTQEEERSPARLVTDAREFADERRTVSFAGQLRVEARDPDGGSFVQRATIEGRARLPEDARYRIVTEGFVSEIITLGDRLYTRDAEGTDELRGRKWTTFDPDQADDRSGVVRPDGPAEGSDVLGDPIGLLRLLDAARRPDVVRRQGDVTVVKADVDAAELFANAVEGAAERGTIELTLRGEVLQRLVFDASGGGGNVHADYRFTRWGSKVELAAPADGELDPTPGIEEEAIAAFKDARLLQPRGIPAGWVLEFAGILPEEMTAEGCEQLELDYVDLEDPDAGYLTLYELPSSCTDMDPPRGAESFRAGGYAGFADEGRDGVLVQILVGDTIVQAESDLPLDALARILADLVPLDLATPPAPLDGFGRTTPA
jgi:hypothetical protein